jgi:hypothetical protein
MTRKISSSKKKSLLMQEERNCVKLPRITLIWEFKEEGILRQDGFCKGKYADRVIYSILAEEYFKRKKT